MSASMFMAGLNVVVWLVSFTLAKNDRLPHLSAAITAACWLIAELQLQAMRGAL